MNYDIQNRVTERQGKKLIGADALQISDLVGHKRGKTK